MGPWARGRAPGRGHPGGRAPPFPRKTLRKNGTRKNGHPGSWENAFLKTFLEKWARKIRIQFLELVPKGKWARARARARAKRAGQTGQGQKGRPNGPGPNGPAKRARAKWAGQMGQGQMGRPNGPGPNGPAKRAKAKWAGAGGWAHNMRHWKQLRRKVLRSIVPLVRN